MARRVEPSSRAASKSKPKKPTRFIRRRLDQIRRIHDEGMKKADGQLSAAHRRASRKNTRRIDTRSTSRTSKTKATTQHQYKQTWDNLIKDWTEGMARVERHRRRGPRRGRAPIPRLAAARARRLEAAGRGPARPAFRRLQRRPDQFPERVAARPPAQIGADSFRAAGPACRSPFRARCSSRRPTPARTRRSSCSRRSCCAT